ncbi:FtsB family cell division protein [Dietzia sp.]|uniref:FtsB family cell division protein n=1 Tax=Dietzia sp. TaxID=1871616 RepID=UPI002FDAABC9
MAGGRGPASTPTRRSAAPATSRRTAQTQPAGASGRQRRELGGSTGISGSLASSARLRQTRPLQVRNDAPDTVLGPRGFALRRVGILALVMIFLVVSISVPVSNHYEFVDQQRSLSKEQTQLESQISDLQRQQNKLNDPEYIQAQARQRFGAVMPGETPYRVVNDQSAERAAANAAAEQEANKRPWNDVVWGSIAGNRG